MTTATLNHAITTHSSRPSFFSSFINWCTAQEENRILWIGLGLTIHGCILTPITVLTILISGSGMGMLGITPAMFAMASVLVVNLAAMPTKITIPVFAISILVDIALIMAALL